MVFHLEALNAPLVFVSCEARELDHEMDGSCSPNGGRSGIRFRWAASAQQFVDPASGKGRGKEQLRVRVQCADLMALPRLWRPKELGDLRLSGQLLWSCGLTFASARLRCYAAVRTVSLPVICNGTHSRNGKHSGCSKLCSCSSQMGRIGTKVLEDHPCNPEQAIIPDTGLRTDD